MSNAEIADRLFVTAGTVKWYFKQIYSKLDVHSRQQAIDKVERLGLLQRGGQRPAPPSAGEPASTVSEAAVPAGDLENPYKGLRAFQEADAADYFGRAGMTERLLSRLSETGDSARFLVIVGPSGSGKSSLVRAGLMPALRSGALANSPTPFIADLYPGTHPLEELEAALLRVAVNPLPRLLDHLREDRRGLVRAARQVLPNDLETELVVVVDQFEEVFTLVADEAMRMQFIDNLLSAATDPRGRVRVILTLRADFYDRPLLVPRLAELVRASTEVIVPLSAREMEQAITAPAERVGLRLEAGLVATMLKDVGEQPGTLPLLQYALTELFERREGVTLTLAAYQSMSGVKGALTRRADEIYASLDAQLQALARQVFLRMVTLGEGVEDTRRPVLLAELNALGDEASVDEVVTAFGDYRLLTFDHDPITRGPTVEIAHEALLREWGELKVWLNESRDDIRLQRQLSAAAHDWQSASRDESFLLRGARLNQFDGWADETALALTPDEWNYLEASRDAYEQAQAAEAERLEREDKLRQRSQAFLRGLVAVLLVAVAVAAILTALAVSSANDADRERDAAQVERERAESQAALAEQERMRAEDFARLSQARELVGYVSDQLNTDPALSALLALQAVNLTYASDETVLPEANTALHQAMQGMRSSVGIRTAEWPEGYILATDFTADGNRITYPFAVITDFSGGALTAISDASTGEFLYTIDGWQASDIVLDNRVLTVFQSPETGTELQIWDISSTDQAELLRTIPISDLNEPIGVWVSANLRTYMLWTERGGLQVWDMESGEEVTTDDVRAMADDILIGFSPDGSLFARWNPDGTITMFDTTTWLPAFTLAPADAQIAMIFTTASVPAVFSSDSRYIAASILPDGVSLWDLTTQEEWQFATPFPPDRVALNADGSRLAASTEAGDLIIWDTATQTEVSHFGVTDVEWMTFNDDGSRLATMRSGLLQIWDTSAGEDFLTMVNSPPQTGASPPGLAYSPDGGRVVAAIVTETPIVWDALTGEKIFTLEGHTDTARALAWSDDGATIAGTSDDGTLILWDAETGEVLHTLDAYSSPFTGVSFSSDSRRVATSGSDQTICIWDVATGELLSSFGTGTGTLWFDWSPDGANLALGRTIPDDVIGRVGIYDVEFW